MRSWIIKYQGDDLDVFLVQEGVCQAQGAMTLAALKAEASDDPIIYLMPTKHVSFVTITLPHAKLSVIRQALPGLLEEQLASDIDSLQLALPEDAKPGESTTVAVIDKTHLTETLQLLRDAKLNVQAMVPDVFVLPYVQNAWTQWVDGDRTVVRTGPCTGFVSETGQVTTWAAQSLDKGSDALASVTESLAEQLSTALQSTWPINLMQDEYAPKRMKQHKGIWEKLSYFVVGVLLVHFVYLGASSMILNHRLAALKAQSLSLYADVYPGATKVTSPKALIARELTQLGAGGDATFLVLLSYLSEALKQTKQITLQQLQYANGTLTVHVTAKDFEALDNMKAALNAMPLNVTQAQATSTAQGVESQFLLRAQGGQS